MFGRDVKVLETMVNSSRDIFSSIDKHGYILYINDACERIFGYKSPELVGHRISEFLHPEDIEHTRVAIQKISQNKQQVVINNRYMHKSRHAVYMSWSVVFSETDDVLYFVGRDISEDNLNSKLLFEKEELHRALCEHGSDMLALFNESLQFSYSGGSTTRILGYSSEQLIGVNVLDLIHPDDLTKVEEKLQLVLNSREHTTISDFRFKNAAGEWRWLETCLSNQLHNPAVCALVTSTRDVTEKYLDRLRLVESEQRFKSMFKDNPDTVLIEDREGVILDANKAAEVRIGLPKNEIIGKHITSFLPPDTISLCMQYLNEAFEGNTVRFELRSDFEGFGELVLDITKIPMSASGKVKGVCTVIKDITAQAKFNKATEEHAGKLTAIFESITDAFCTIDNNWKYTYINREFERLTGYEKEAIVGKSFFEIYPDAYGNIFHANYSKAMETGKSITFEAYSPELKLWLNIKVFPSKEGLSIYFSDVTDKVKAQEELEKLSLVAKHTNNGVIITDVNRRIEWVNEGFTRITGYSSEEAIGKIPSEILHKPGGFAPGFEQIKEEMLQGKAVSFEVLNYKKSGDIVWLSVQVSPVFNSNKQLSRFVTVQTDITEKKKALLELEKLSLVASRTDNGVVITDANGLTEWVNDGFTRITGYTLSEMIGKKPGDLLRGKETDKNAAEKFSEKLKEGVHFSSTLLNYRKSGEKFWLAMDITPILDEQGEIVKFVAIQKDITFRKESEEKLLKMTRDLYAQNTDLQQFTYIVSHNLRAPVANAMGLAYLLTKIDKDTPLYEASVSNLKQSLFQLDTVLRDMNTILSIRDGKNNLEKEGVKLKQTINQALTALEESFLKGNGTLTIDVEEQLLVKANKAYLYSVFYNLFSNAIKYRSTERDLEVHIRCLGKTKKGILISFEDNGIGFDMQKAKDNVFKLYKRFHTDRKGRGIGLYLMKAHLDAMGGHIRVNSKINVGTRFLIYLPNS